MPMAFDPNLLGAVDDLDQDPLEQQTDDGLTLFAGSGLRVPQCGQVLCQVLHCCELRRTWRLRSFTPEAIVLRLPSRLFGQGLLPAVLERSAHQPVLRFDGGILSTHPVDVVVRSLQTLLPMTIKRRTLSLNIVGHCDGGLK